MRILIPTVAALLGAAAARTTPLLARLFELEARVDVLEKELEIRKEGSEFCHERVVAFAEYTNDALTEIRAEIRKLHGFNSSLSGDAPSLALGEYVTIEGACTPWVLSPIRRGEGGLVPRDAGPPTPRDAGRR